MNDQRLDPPVRNRVRDAAARRAPGGAAGPLLFSGMAAMTIAGVLAARGQARGSALALVVAVLALMPALARPASSPFASYVGALVDRVGDAVVLAPLAWPLAHGAVQEGAPAVAALGLLFVGAYAQVRARAHGYPVPVAVDGAPERAAILAAGLFAPGTLLEPALWIVAAMGAAAATRATMVVWKARG